MLPFSISGEKGNKPAFITKQSCTYGGVKTKEKDIVKNIPENLLKSPIELSTNFSLSSWWLYTRLLWPYFHAGVQTDIHFLITLQS